MIRYENIKASNFFTEGLELSIPSSMEIAITSGSFTINETVYEYPEIEFDVEPDNELFVQYDVYLLSQSGTDNNMVHIDRTEIGQYTLPNYEGDGKLQHTLVSFTVPPGLTDLNELDILVRNVIMEEEVDADEIPTE